MDNSDKNKLIEVGTLIIGVLNFTFLIIGGYFLIGQYEGKMYESNTKLADIQANLAEMQLSVSETNNRLDIFSKNVSLTENSIKLIESIRPNFTFSVNPDVKYENNKITITFELQNNGSYELSVNPKRFHLFINPYRNNLLNVNKKEGYVKNINIDKIDTIRGLNKGEKQGHTFTVEVKQNMPSEVYYYMEYQVTTQDYIVEIISNMAESIGVTNVKKLGSLPVYRYGKLTFNDEKT